MKFLTASGLLLAVLTLFSACTKTEKVNCTTSFNMVSVALKDEKGFPVPDATVYTIRQSNGDTLNLGIQQPRTGDYIIISDNQKMVVSQQGENFKFLARKGNLFVSAIYKVRSDLCHVIYVSGPDELILK